MTLLFEMIVIIHAINWNHMLIVPDENALDTDPSIILRFNYTLQRELFEIKKMIAGRIPAGLNGSYN